MPVHRVDAPSEDRLHTRHPTRHRRDVGNSPQRCESREARRIRVTHLYDADDDFWTGQTDAVRQILCFLDARSLGLFASTTPALRRASGEDAVWRVLCARDFGVIFVSDDCDFRSTYKKALRELVLFRDGKPDYVQFLGGRGDAQDAMWTKKGIWGNITEIMCAW